MDLIAYNGWENNIRLTSGEAELVITLDVGPRIIRYGLIGEENILGEILEQSGEAREQTWMIRGGHRLWVAPESKEVSYELDNEPVHYEETTQGVRVIQEPGELSGIQKKMEIALLQDSSVKIRHILKNTTNEKLTYAVWPLTVMRKGGDVIVPLPGKDPFGQHSNAPNQIWSIWSFSDLSGKRFNIEEEYLRIQNRDGYRPFKIGVLNKEGWMAYHNDDYVFVKRFLYRHGETYPDGNVNCEVYMDDSFVELETLSALTEMQSGQSVCFDEVWNLFKGTDCVEKFLAAI